MRKGERSVVALSAGTTQGTARSVEKIISLAYRALPRRGSWRDPGDHGGWGREGASLGSVTVKRAVAERGVPPPFSPVAGVKSVLEQDERAVGKGN